jgi:hypothetical protein
MAASLAALEEQSSVWRVVWEVIWLERVNNLDGYWLLSVQPL